MSCLGDSRRPAEGQRFAPSVGIKRGFWGFSSAERFCVNTFLPEGVGRSSRSLRTDGGYSPNSLKKGRLLAPVLFIYWQLQGRAGVEAVSLMAPGATVTRTIRPP